MYLSHMHCLLQRLIFYDIPNFIWDDFSVTLRLIEVPFSCYLRVLYNMSLPVIMMEEQIIVRKL